MSAAATAYRKGHDAKGKELKARVRRRTKPNNVAHLWGGSQIQPSSACVRRLPLKRGLQERGSMFSSKLRACRCAACHGSLQFDAKRRVRGAGLLRLLLFVCASATQLCCAIILRCMTVSLSGRFSTSILFALL